MKKINKKGFFLVETMVVIAVVGIVLTFLFKTFSSVYTRFSTSEHYNTVDTINAASYIKQYIDKTNISYEDLLNGLSYVELTANNDLLNEYYDLLKDRLDIAKIYLINLQSFFENENNLNNFNINFRGYLKTLSKDNAQYKIVIIDVNNDFGSISAFDYYLTLIGDQTDEYVTYVPLNANYVEPGYEAKDNNGNDLETIITGTVSTNAVGTYYLNYSTGAITLRRKVIVYKEVYNYDYTGNYQTFVAPFDGKYQIELWGAQAPGGNGKGAYTTGNIYLFKGQKLYVYVGETKSVGNSESFNGGISSSGGTPGGGATDVRLTSGNWKDIVSLRSRIMVAAGGGSGAVAGAHGGALTGLKAGVATGGTQTTFGTAESASYYTASFGVGGGGCGGGGGYYGGGGATCVNGGAGGSSFISAYPGCNAITRDGVHTGQANHYSGYRFTNTSMVAGDSLMPNPRGTGQITGNNGAGYARITLLKTNPDNNLKKVRFIYSQTNGSTASASNVWVEIQAIDLNGENIALGKTVTGSSAAHGSYSPYSIITDGVTTSDPYARSSVDGLQYVLVDLGAEYDLSSIQIWHYYNDPRTFYENEVKVAGANLAYRTVNNTNYQETSDGLIIRPTATN